MQSNILQYNDIDIAKEHAMQQSMTHQTFSTKQLDIELGRFFRAADALKAATGEIAKMPACIVDERWHDLLGTPEYTALVEGALGAGTRITHQKSGGYDVMTWVPFYEAANGPLAASWFSRADGTFDEQAYAAYQAGEELWMSWDCGPITGD